MNLTERQNYGIAFILAVILHGLLLLITFPVAVTIGNTNLDTYSTGLIDMNAEPQDLPLETQPLPPVNVPETKFSRERSKVPDSKVATAPIKPVGKPADQTILKPTEDKPQQGSISKNGPAGAKPGGVGTPSAPAAPAAKSLGDGNGMFSKKGIIKQPVYPKSAVTEGIEGDVKLRILVLADGNIEAIELLSSGSDLRLVKSAKDYIYKDWHFNANHQPYYVDVLMLFRIREPFTYQLLGAHTRF